VEDRETETALEPSAGMEPRRDIVEAWSERAEEPSE
jgi:hypothetical protein